MLPRAYASAAAILVLAAASAACARPQQAQETMTRTWTGGDRLVVAVPAEVRYAPGPANQVVITGPREKVEHITVEHGVIGWRRNEWGGWFWGWSWSPSDEVHVVVTTPRLSSVVVAGPGRLDLGRLSQDRLDLTMTGPGHINASGPIRTVNVVVTGPGHVRLDAMNADDMKIVVTGPGGVSATGAAQSAHVTDMGPGRVDLAELKLQDSDVGVMGPGGVAIAPLRSANVHITGPGSVRLLSNPPQLSMSVTGFGRLIRTSG